MDGCPVLTDRNSVLLCLYAYATAPLQVKRYIMNIFEVSCHNSPINWFLSIISILHAINRKQILLFGKQSSKPDASPGLGPLFFKSLKI